MRRVQLVQRGAGLKHADRGAALVKLWLRRDASATMARGR